MKIPVSQAAEILERRKILKRTGHDHSERIIDYVTEAIDRPLPSDLADFYRERIEEVGGFAAIFPEWNDRVGWRPMSVQMTDLLHAQAAPLFLDGFGNLFGLDLRSDEAVPAVYFFDHEAGYENPVYCAGSSLGAFLVLLADHWRAVDEGWLPGWQLAIDPDIDKCPRAPPLWLAS